MGNPWHLGLLDLNRYPIEDLSHPKRAQLIDQYLSDMDRTGAAEIAGFLTEEGTRRMTQESITLETRAFHNALVGNAYLDDPDPSWPADHARRMTEPSSLGVIAYDQIPESHLIRQIYEWDPLMHFIKVRFVDAVVYLFVFAAFTNALLTQRTFYTIGLAATICFLFES